MPTEELQEESTELIESVEETQEESATQEPETFEFGGMQFAEKEQAVKTFKEMQARATRAEQELSKVKSTIEKEKFKAEFQELDADEKMNRLADLMLQKEQAEEQVETTQTATEHFEDDMSTINQFVKTNPVLAGNSELAQMFSELALSPKFRDATLDSLYKVKIQPLIEKLSGTKIIQKKVVPTGRTVQGFTNEQIARMSPSEYEKHRAEILNSLTKK
jgi:hypothetical protein